MPRLPLDKMTIEEKLEAMEEIWDDLCKRPDSIPVPSWHGEVLAQREAARLRGEIEYEELDVARARIMKDVERRRGR